MCNADSNRMWVRVLIDRGEKVKPRIMQTAMTQVTLDIDFVHCGAHGFNEFIPCIHSIEGAKSFTLRIVRVGCHRGEHVLHT